MNTFNLKKAAEQALVLLEENGASAKTIKGYKNTGFGAAIRHFTAQGIFDVNATMLDSFVLEQRKCFENGKFSEWKWRLVRRGSELLKHFVQTSTLSLPELRPWDSVLGKPRQSLELDAPTPEQLVDPDDIFALAWRIKQELHKLGLTQNTIRHYTTEGLTVILRKHISLGLKHYSEPLVAEIVSEIRVRYEQKLTSRVSYQNLRKAGALLSEMHQTGRITFSVVSNWGLREPTPEFSKLLRHFCENANRTGILAKGTVKTSKSAIRNFFFDLEGSGIQSFDRITLSEISDSITNMAKRYTGGMHSAVFSVRIFLKHLHQNGFTHDDLSLAVPEMIARRTAFREGFTCDETGRLLEVPNLETAIGKRDYAMMLLAVQTGLRACDVVNLKREDIDWRSREIRIIQQKTGKPLALPLESESGNAIADYLLTARPESDLPYIFLCHIGTLRPINNRSASAIATKYLQRAGIVSAIPRRGFHSFRRAFGTRLLQNEISLELLRQLLGHTKIDSAKPYLSVNEQGLKTCALGLVSSRKAGNLR